MYPKIRVDLVRLSDYAYALDTHACQLIVRGKFTPAMVDYLANELEIPKNFMFMACPNSHFPHNIGEFGGVRLITH